ncbi:putative ATPase N2B isoform X1 [Dendrobium catenatum]|uniref:Lactation elevated protein 1 n=2 Tax=Dendrobium catenatum TaxID=906689 RepID=A0A2I0X8D0_9ASPA|nr:putative ATPase N2B isoform X1 [Dendrobium catenatum]XP_020688876.1 putative ATPase N2B isoform X1 [Dendrobium catenatum]PKU84187.1 hypothetical protein MA16_Dca002699 [Dendrobium catenatum]
MRVISSATLLLCRSLSGGTLGRRSCTLQSTRARCYCDRSHSSAERRNPGPLVLYKSMVEDGKLQHDTFQEKVAMEFEDLLLRLEHYEKEMEEYHKKLANWENVRENESRRLMLEEAELRHKDGEWTRSNYRESWFLERWMLRRRRGNPEPGVGRMVSYLNRERKIDSLAGERPVLPQAPKGIYLYGNVGSGKTMLMDMFYSATEGIVKHRRRFHFHEAMLEIHEHMHNAWKNKIKDKSLHSRMFTWIHNLPFDSKVKEWLIGEERYKQETREKHILHAVADKFLVDRQSAKSGATILCFDEIQTVDVFAIVALSGILSSLLSSGTILVATSNRAPEDLNQDGMQKEIFQKLVSKLDECCQKISVGSEIDYRRLMPSENSNQVRYFWPLNSDNCREFDKIWKEVISQSGVKPTFNAISVMFGRVLMVPESCSGIARFNFDYLCGRATGAADYIAIARNYHTIFISDIPMMSMRIRDKARRFITLIDELYNHHCCLFCLADASIEDLFEGTDEGTLFDLESFQFETETEGVRLRRDVLTAGSVGLGPTSTGIASLMSGQEEMFAFRRAVSRLIEMQKPLYIEGVHILHPMYQQQHGHL